MLADVDFADHDHRPGGPGGPHAHAWGRTAHSHLLRQLCGRAECAGAATHNIHVGPASARLALADLPLAGRPARILAERQVSVADLVSMTREELLAIDGVGEGSAHNISWALRQVGLSLAPSPPRPESQQRQAARRRGAAMAERWLAGETLDSIAAGAGVSRERVRQLIWTADPRARERKLAARRARSDS